MNLHITDSQWPEFMLTMYSKPSCKLIRCCKVNQWLRCFVTLDEGLYHLSISHLRRYPTWDEIREVRYALLPADRTFALLLPPKSEYVNLHPNCFHLTEVPELHEAKP